MIIMFIINDASNILDKYENRPHNFEQLCLADFASMYDYTGKSEKEQERTEDIKS